MRRFAVILSAVALFCGAALARPVPALADYPQLFVGGGAAAVSVGALFVYQDVTDPIGQPGIESAGITEVEPVVTMGPEGGGEYKSIAAEDLGVVYVDAGQVGIHGNMYGTPYAQGWAHLNKVAVRIPGAPVLEFNSVNADCNWTGDGASGVTSISQGTAGFYSPGPNTVEPLPGIGYATLNEQEFHTTWIPGPNGAYAATVISVAAVHIHLSAGLSKSFGQSDIYLANALCDPTKIINLSGIGVGPYVPVGGGSGG